MNSNIDKSLFQFLTELNENNNRDWFNDNKTKFQKIQGQFKIVFNQLLTQMKVHDDIENLKIFRIYRDVRFSKNKLPYKTHMSAALHRRKPQLRGGYYVHLAPNNESFIAVGFWDPNKDDLFRIRKELEMDASEFKSIIHQTELKKLWGNLEGESLKTAPRDFDKEHPDIELIRMKQFIFTKTFTDQEVMHEDFIHTVNQSFKAIRPFFDLMSDVLTTNLNGEPLI
ncbi:DUF2461 domain-containing protein [Paucihalobacter sp.]|uniref:DUF2461 domain-containing protein n=1 Tax=Paucihalobacter sp. TaxID=2850405 RepID=UPI002FE3518E